MFQEDRRAFLRSLPVAAGSIGVAGSICAVQAGDGSTAASPRRVVAGGAKLFSRAVILDRMAFVSGVLGRDEKSGEMVSPDFEPQCRQVLMNLKASVEAAGSSLDKVLKCTCFLTAASDFSTFNKIYAEFFPADPPARSTVVVKELVAPGAKVEIDCVTSL